MQLEKRARWPRLTAERDRNPAIFDEYLGRIQQLMPEPTFQRDEILETIGMDLARAPEQIRQVWNLRYAEQVRWPKEDVGEKFTKAQLYNAIGQMLFEIVLNADNNYLYEVKGLVEGTYFLRSGKETCRVVVN